MSTNIEYDAYGFPKENKVETRKDDMMKWLKIFFWLFIVFLIMTRIILMGVAGYVSFYEFQTESRIFIRILKIFTAITFTEIYLGYKGLVSMNILV
jgi:polyferredoxin